MCTKEKQTEALLQQVALSLANITFALDEILEDSVHLEEFNAKLARGLELIRDHTSHTFERIYDFRNPVPEYQRNPEAGAIASALSGFPQKCA